MEQWNQTAPLTFWSRLRGISRRRRFHEVSWHRLPGEDGSRKGPMGWTVHTLIQGKASSTALGKQLWCSFRLTRSGLALSGSIHRCFHDRDTLAHQRSNLISHVVRQKICNPHNPAAFTRSEDLH